MATPTISENYSINGIHARIFPAFIVHLNNEVCSTFTGHHVRNGWMSNESDAADIFHYFQKEIIPRSFQEIHSSDRIAIPAAAYSEQDGRNGN